MRTTTMQRLDATAGRLGCAVLTAVRRVDDARRPAPQRPVERLAVVKLAEQGATVVAAEALDRAARLVGRDNLYMVVFAENRAIADELGIVPMHNILTVRSDTPWVLARDVARTVRRLRRLRIDAAVDFEFFSRASAIVTYLSGARVRSGLHAARGSGPWRGDLMTHHVAADVGQHASITFAAIVGALADDPTVAPPSTDDAAPFALPMIRPTAAELASMSARLTDRFGRTDVGPIVVLNANAGDLLPLRRWPPERYVAVARQLLDDDPQVGIVLTGSAGEVAAVQGIERAIGSPRCVSLAGETTMRELLVLYTLADVLVTNDSGPAHYAALTPIEVVTLFGPETPAVFGALSPRHRHLYAGVPCSPCVNVLNERKTSCRDNVCMQRIDVDTVAAAAADALLRRRERAATGAGT